MSGPDMKLEAAGEAMGRMATAGSDMTTGWGAVTTDLTGLAGQLGRGELGAAFLEGYQQPAGEMMKAADECCQVPGHLAELGRQAVELYRSGNDGAHDQVAAVDVPDSTRL